MNIQDFLKNIIDDVAVDLTQEFDKNFQRKAFFDKKWEDTNHPNSRGSLMMRSGRLRKSINHKKRKSSIGWTSNLPYATIHNEGGEFEVTEKMKRFFWAMYYKASGGILFNVRKKRAADTIRNRKLSAEASKWKAMALMKVGTKIKVKQRQYIGWHPVVDKRIVTIVNHNLEILNDQITKSLKQ